MILIIVSLFYFGLSQWKLIDTIIINETDLTLNDWQQQNSSVGSCVTSNEKNVIISQNGSLVKQYSHKVQGIQLVLDVYYDFYNFETNSQSEMNITLNGTYGKNLQNKIINPTDLKLQSKICSNTLESYPFQQETIITGIIETNQYPFSLNISFTNNNSDYSNKLRIRNLYVYGFICYSVCQSCTIGLSSSCISCYNIASNTCTCNYPTKYVIKQIGCVQECPRDDYLTSAYYECYLDKRIKSQYYFLNTSLELGQLLTPNILLNIDYPGISSIFTTKKIEIPLGTLQPNMTLIRVRVSIYFKLIEINSYWKIGLDSVNQSQIYKNSTGVFIGLLSNLESYVRAQWLYADTLNLNLPLEINKVRRLEFLLANKNTNPVLFFEDFQCSWAFFNLTIDIGVCKLNCLTCKTPVTCSVCQEGYKLYDSKCLQTCPSYTQSNSTHCIDYQKIISYSNYLVKAFYDNKMTLDEIFSNIDLVTNLNQTILTDQNFSYIQNKIVLGGMLVWNNSIYQKTYNIPYNPHYNVSIRFNITFGDHFQGAFKYCFDSTFCNEIIRVTSALDQNIIGQQTAETIQHVYENIQHTNTQLQIMFECKSNNYIIDGFCAISDYFIIIHQCNENLNCLTCNQMDQCASCVFQDDNKRYLMKGKCICNQYFNRVYYNSQCQCQYGYQDLQNKFYCEPICGDMLIVKGEDCDDGNLDPYDGCHQCKYQCAIECNLCVKGKCLECENNYNLIYDECYPTCNQFNTKYPCAIGKFLIQNSETTIQKFEIHINNFNNNTNDPQTCGNYLIEGSEQCDDNSLVPFEGCHQCQFVCSEHCQFCVKGICEICDTDWNLTLNQCIPICGNLILQGNEQCESQTPDLNTGGCLFCQCIEGYLPMDENCISICGDEIQTIEEECDDGNLIGLDGCSQKCKIECINCIDCIIGICQQCQSGYYYDQNQICNKTICGDQIKVEQEQCDDGNLVQNDGCYDCLCEQGYQNTQIGCQSICGDGIIVKGEQCEDNNNIQYDGCYNCQYDCNEECQICQQNICLQCNNGFNLINNDCINVCGDGLLNKNKEQCDDSNNIPRDGCYNCQIEQGYICYDNNLIFLNCQRCQDSNCNKCILDNQIEKCQQCQQGYYLNEKQDCIKCDNICIDCIDQSKNCINYNYQVYQVKDCDNSKGLYYNFNKRDCESKCGDGIIVGNEQCDDKNIDDFDGCNSKCQIEKGFLFDIENQQLIQYPKIDAILDEKEIQSNSYLFSLKSKVETQIINCSETKLKVDQFISDDFNFTTNSNNTNCQIQLQYFKTISTQNIIHIYIKHLSKYKTRLLSEEEDQFLIEIKIEPKKQVYVSEKQKEQAKSIAQTQQAMSQSLMILGPMAIFMGGFQFIWAILDILSWLNNFYYLNVKYPINVEQVFLQAEWSNIIQFPSIDYFNNQDSNYYFEAPKKFNDKGVDPLFFNNIQSVLFFLAQVLLTKMFCKGFIKIIYCFCRKTTSHHSNIRIFKLNTINKGTVTEQYTDNTQTIEIIVPSLLQSTFKKCLEFEEYFIANLLKVLQINFLDLTLAVMLQLTNQETQNYIVVRINIICSYFTLLLLFFILYFSYTISTQHKLLLENKKFKTHYGCFYEDVNTDSNIAMLYSLVNLLRKAVFIIATVYFYDKPIYQTSFCFLSSLLNLLILVNQNPFESRQQYILNIIPDTSVMIVTAVAISLAFQDTFNILSDVVIEVLGWLIVSCIYSAIGIQLIFLIKQILMEMYEKIKKLKQYLLGQ